jgi:membrane fusion protein, multidrug efflux system
MSIKGRIASLLVAGVVIAAVAGVYYMPQPEPPRQSQGASKGGSRGGGGGSGGGGGGQRGAGLSNAPVPVRAAPAKLDNVPVYLDAVGTAKALNTVTVRSQVDGKIIKISFREGQDVQKGYVLAKIDPITYQAAYDQTLAKKAQDEAQLANARLDLERYTRLAATNAVNKQQLDTQRAMVAQLEAQIKLDQAAVDNARQILSWTDVVAPITGRTGIRLIDEGNIVKATDSSGIVILTELRPISIFFNMPQQHLPELNKGFGEGPLEVDAIGADGKTVLDRGKVVVIDNQVDQTTGTVKLKAEFPNESLQLWPGQFVNVRVLMDMLRQVIVVPTAAVQRGPNGTLVYLLKDDSKVTVRPVTIKQQDDVRSVIQAGLQPGERVVTTGFARLTEGTSVTVSGGEDIGQPTASDQRPHPQGAPGRRSRRDGQAGADDQPRPDGQGTLGEGPRSEGQAIPPDGPRPDGARSRRGGERRNPSSGVPPARNP